MTPCVLKMASMWKLSYLCSEVCINVTPSRGRLLNMSYRKHNLEIIYLFVFKVKKGVLAQATNTRKKFTFLTCKVTQYFLH